MSIFPRVAEPEADGKVKSLFQDTKATLGVAAVGDIFEELAVYPWCLQLAWRNLKPNAQTVYFQRTALELEDMALRAAGRHRTRSGAGESIPSPTEARVDLEAKLLVATAAIRYGTNGQLPKMLWLSSADTQSSNPATVETLPADTPEPAAESQLTRELRQHAALCAESLPYRMEISASALRQSGLSEEDIDSVRAIVNAAWDRIPRILAAAAAMNSEPKSASPEPVTAG